MHNNNLIFLWSIAIYILYLVVFYCRNIMTIVILVSKSLACRSTYWIAISFLFQCCEGKYFFLRNLSHVQSTLSYRLFLMRLKFYQIVSNRLFVCKCIIAHKFTCLLITDISALKSLLTDDSLLTRPLQNENTSIQYQVWFLNTEVSVSVFNLKSTE